MSDKIQWKRSIQQDGIDQGSLPDPKKLVIKGGHPTVARNPSFTVYNRNFHRVSKMTLKSDQMYYFGSDTILTYNKSIGPQCYYVDKVEKSLDVFPSVIINNDTFRMHAKCSNDAIITVYPSYLTTEDEIIPFGINGVKSVNNDGIISLELIKTDSMNICPEWFTMRGSTIITTDKDCELSDIYCYWNDDLNQYIESKYQDIDLDCQLTSSDVIEFDYNHSKWVWNNGELSESDQEKLNTIEFYEDGTYIMIYKPSTLPLSDNNNNYDEKVGDKEFRYPYPFCTVELSE